MSMQYRPWSEVRVNVVQKSHCPNQDLQRGKQIVHVEIRQGLLCRPAITLVTRSLQQEHQQPLQHVLQNVQRDTLCRRYPSTQLRKRPWEHKDGVLGLPLPPLRERLAQPRTSAAAFVLTPIGKAGEEDAVAWESASGQGSCDANKHEHKQILLQWPTEAFPLLQQSHIRNPSEPPPRAPSHCRCSTRLSFRVSRTCSRSQSVHSSALPLPAVLRLSSPAAPRLLL
ncbi:hypothetical protein C8Q74DRAFT_1304485, partial [Fomes fomentarius]